MSLLGSILILISAMLHAGWNILGKNNSGSSGAGLAFIIATSFSGSIILTPYLIWYISTIGWSLIPNNFWIFLLISGLSQIIYLISLIFAYKYADIGTIYPIARALPLIMVGGLSVLMGDILTIQQWIGFIIITVGCIIVPLTSLYKIKLSSYLNMGVLWAFIAAIGTTGYSIIDKKSLTLLSESLSQILDDQYTAIFFLGMQNWAITLPIIISCLAINKTSVLKTAWYIRKDSISASIMMALTYGLVLFAMTMTNNVSLIVALRQISIVFGLIMGIWFLSEKFHITRALGVCFILIGILLTLVT